MKYFAYLTSSCLENAQRHGVPDAVQRLAEKVEKDQAISSWDKFLPSPFVKKKLGRDWRIIAEKRMLPNRDGIIVICLFAFFSRGGHEYENFRDAPAAFSASLLPSDQELEAFITKRIDQPVTLLPCPSEIEYSYLYNQFDGLDNSLGTVYETKEWVDLIKKAENKQGWFYDLVGEAVKAENATKTHLSKNNQHLLYRHFSDLNCTLLIAPLTDSEKWRQAEFEHRYQLFLNGGSPSEIELLKISSRSYPAFITADDNIWLRIQDNTEANLALSPEESAILDSVTRPGGAHAKTYPLFINGRPGSGKSTILQYLFAEHLYLHLSKDHAERISSPPIYLTYSEKLLKWAQTVVKSLIRCNSKIVLQGAALIEEDLDPTIDKCFAQFHKFLRDLLPAEEKEDFDPSKRIDFPDFRNRLIEKLKSNPDADLRKISPELVWHVIRTYIKGMRDDENNYLDIESYEELPPDQRTVEKDTYRRIFDRVWEGWYQPLCEGDGYWDDQDLTRKLLNSDDIKTAKHPAVFCDEAQDFTKIELEMILRLSLFSRRTLKPADLKLIPFAFAGDPFQTLNPTGFDWGAVQAGFHEKIVQELDKTLKNNLEFNYQELHYNYRSTRHIVGFCNLIQLLRGILFGIKHLRPQRSWFEQDAPPPVYFDVEQPACQEKLKEQSEIVIILPCQEGEEEQFINDDPLLKELASGDVRNFLSPMSAKGLEFSRVVLYKFGESYCQSYPRLLEPVETGRPYSDNPEEGLPLEYFINRLYVAASRPKRRLFIVDSRRGIEKLWNSDRLKNPAELLSRYSHAQANDWTEEDLTLLQPGQEVNWSEDKDDAEQLGQQFLEEGIATKDPYKLMLAEANFRRAGAKCRLKERESRALRHEVEGDLVSAGRIFLELGKHLESLRLLWKAKAYGEICEHGTFANTIEQHAASFKLANKSVAGCLSFLDFLHEEATGANRVKIISDPHWSEIGGALVAALLDVAHEDINWPAVYGKIEAMMAEGLTFIHKAALAELAFRANRYQDAINFWSDDLPVAQRNSSYKKAKAETTEYPDNIHWLAELKDYAGIVKMYESNAGSALTAVPADEILGAYLQLNRLNEAVEFLRRHPFKESIRRLNEETKKTEDRELILRSTELLLQSQLRSGQWRDALDLVNKGRWKSLERGSLHAVLISELSVSDALAADTIENQQLVVADYLKRQLGNMAMNPRITQQALGAAIERAGRIIDSLAFYEAIWKGKSNDGAEVLQFAKERWLKSKYRQVEYSRRQGKEAEANRQKDEADRMSQVWGINALALPDFPELANASDAEPLGGSVTSAPQLSEEEIETIRDLLGIKYTTERIAKLLRVSVQEVEKVNLSFVGGARELLEDGPSALADGA